MLSVQSWGSVAKFFYTAPNPLGFRGNSHNNKERNYDGPLGCGSQMLLRLLIFSALSVAGLCHAQVVGSLALTSDYVHRGLSQTNGSPALQAGIGVHSESGYYAQLWGSTLDTSELAPDFGDSLAYEADLVVGTGQVLSDNLVLDLSVGRYESFGASQILDYDYTEFGAALTYESAVRVAYFYTPRATDHTRTNAKWSGRRHVIEAAGEWPLSERWSINGGVGYSDLSEVSDVSHVFWSFGLGYRVQRYIFTAGVFGTDGDARDRFIDGRADTRVAVGIIVPFGGQ